MNKRHDNIILALYRNYIEIRYIIDNKIIYIILYNIFLI